MTAKRYRIYVNRKGFDYTYDDDTGVARIRLPGTSKFETIQAPNSDDARMDIRGLLEKAMGITAIRNPERTLFLRGTLRTLDDPDITEDDLATALAKVNDAVTDELRERLGINESWRYRMAYANTANQAGLIAQPDAVMLAEIAVFGKVIGD